MEKLLNQPAVPVTSFTPQALHTMAVHLGAQLMDEAYRNWRDHVDEHGNITIDQDALTRRFMEVALLDVSAAESESVIEAILNSPMTALGFSEMEIAIEDNLNEHLAYSNACRSAGSMLEYYGMCERDFR